MKLEIRIKADNHLKQHLLAGLANLLPNHDLDIIPTSPDCDCFELTLFHETDSPDILLDNFASFIAKTESSLPVKNIDILVKNSECSEPTLRAADNNRPYKPVPGIRIVPWSDSNSIDPEPHDIFLDPSSDAFGNGLHPSTRLCLQLLEQVVERNAESQYLSDTMLDIGCGSGILAMAAIRLGVAGSGLGIEIDRHAVETARKNVALNGLEDSVEILRSSWQNVTGLYSMVLANLVPSVLFKAAPYLAKLLYPGGMFITAGFPAARSGQFLRLLEDNGLHLVTESSMAGWGALLLSH